MFAPNLVNLNGVRPPQPPMSGMPVNPPMANPILANPGLHQGFNGGMWGGQPPMSGPIRVPGNLTNMGNYASMLRHPQMGLRY